VVERPNAERLAEIRAAIAETIDGADGGELDSADHAVAECLAEIDALTAERVDERKVFTLEDWGEAEGCVLWWRFPVDEPPYVGDPTWSDWPGYHTHWTRLPPVPWDSRLPEDERRP
jgi:hypothetical protein